MVFFIEQKEQFNLSSITLNNSAKSNGCSSGKAADDPLCPLNSSTPLCIQSMTNPWIFNCSKIPSKSILNSWQIGLICSLIIFFFLTLFLFIGYFLRRYSRSKRIALSCENLFDDIKSMQKNGIPQGQAFQRVPSIIEKQSNISDINILSIDENLHDEDAWMSILAVVNAELDILNRLENEQNQIKTII